MTKTVSIGILSGEAVDVCFHGAYMECNVKYQGWYKFRREELEGELIFTPKDLKESYFELKGVTFGKDFHWQKEECQRFRGSLILRKDGGKITAVNVLPIEEYLKSVIASEMNPNASLEFLKAHAIISRTWLINRILNRRKSSESNGGLTRIYEKSYLPSDEGIIETDKERVRWYDDSQHICFDVCADDHCQRYQGITRITNPNAIEAVESTAGQVLTHNGEIIDARFSKCCGGAFETFENCWQPVHKPCLEAGRDYIDSTKLPNLSDAATARDWIESRPDAFCNTSDTEVLSKVLNDYDLSTKDFYRWTQTYTKDELSDIINRRSGIDFGEVSKLIPLQRGVSGRITRLKIIGTKHSMVIGKELEIRRTLSPSHLYSSAFTIKEDDNQIILHGAGWGHGVGLCQIGAAMMAHIGYTHPEILSHYYPGSTITAL